MQDRFSGRRKNLSISRGSADIDNRRASLPGCDIAGFTSAGFQRPWWGGFEIAADIAGL
jgi:hypothetical protein